MDGKMDRFFEAHIEVSARQKIGDAISNFERLDTAKSQEVQLFNAHRLQLHAMARTAPPVGPK